jgi:hypothetical protein
VMMPSGIMTVAITVSVRITSLSRVLTDAK